MIFCGQKHYYTLEVQCTVRGLCVRVVMSVEGAVTLEGAARALLHVLMDGE
jgi:hypothetical protein